MLSKPKNNVIYLCLLLISLRLVGCTSVTEHSQEQAEEGTEFAPIVDLNAPIEIPQVPPQSEPENSLESEELPTESDLQITPEVAQQDKPQPAPPIDA